MFRKKEETKEEIKEETKEGKKEKGESIKDDILFLYKTIDDMTWSVDILRKPDRGKYILRRLRMRQIIEIVVKFLAFTWAMLWSMMSIICFLTTGVSWVSLLTAVPALAFWVILTKSIGSVTVISMEIKELKKELLAREKKG